jgi:heme/copper-type cytochrome/quinol oxidase subunit 3
LIPAIRSSGVQKKASHGSSQAASAAGRNVEQVEMFYWIYFAMTGMHALHMIIGAGC